MIAQSDINTSKKLSRGLYIGALLSVILGALALRLYELDYRPLHSDEGVNFHFLTKVLATGIFEYSHENYHGPTFFFLSAILVSFLGDSVTVLRLGSVIAGGWLVAATVLSRNIYSSIFVLVGALFLAVSPSLVFFSRYAIHEILFTTCSAWSAFSALQLLHTQKPFWLYSFAATLALAIATKETFVVLLACIGLAVIAELLTQAPRGTCAALLKTLRTHATRSILLFAGILIGVFSSGFVSFAEVRELALGVPQWLGRGVSDEGHFKPARYFTEILLATEPLLLAAPFLLLLTLLILGVRKWFFDSTSKAELQGLVFFGVWGTTALAVYSAIPYKTPWLIINTTLPLSLTLASLVAFLASKGASLKGLAVAFAAAHLTISLVVTSALNYSQHLPIIRLAAQREATPYGSDNPFSYVHTANGFETFLKDLNSYWAKYPDARVLVACENYWPIPYYVRHNASRVHYVTPNGYGEHTQNFDIFVLGPDATPPPEELFRSSYYRLSDVQEAMVWYRIH
jgi:uncharacterized protein (TIGR03663 family)